MKIITLIENKKSDTYLNSEHGFSLYIEHNSQKILFDTGASNAFATNAQKLGVNLKDIDIAIISHHHYDHGGGLRFFLENNHKAKVYLGRKPSGEALFKALGGILKKYIGLDKELFKQYPDRFVFIHNMEQIFPDIFILTSIQNKYPRPKGNSKLMIQKDANLIPDNFEHEIIVVLKDKDELVVLTGCSHSGILNMVETVITHFPNMPINAVLGGFHLAGIPIEHLMPESRQEIEAIGTKMLTYSIKKVYTGHCTGVKGYEILKGVMGNKLDYISSGTSISL